MFKNLDIIIFIQVDYLKALNAHVEIAISPILLYLRQH